MWRPPASASPEAPGAEVSAHRAAGGSRTAGSDDPGAARLHRRPAHIHAANRPRLPVSTPAASADRADACRPLRFPPRYRPVLRRPPTAPETPPRRTNDRLRMGTRAPTRPPAYSGHLATVQPTAPPQGRSRQVRRRRACSRRPRARRRPGRRVWSCTTWTRPATSPATSAHRRQQRADRRPVLARQHRRGGQPERRVDHHQNAEGSGVVLSAPTATSSPTTTSRSTAQGKTCRSPSAAARRSKATLVGTDPKTDLAVFKAEDVSGLTAGEVRRQRRAAGRRHGAGDRQPARPGRLGDRRHRQRAQPHHRRVADQAQPRTRSHRARPEPVRPRRSPAPSRPTPRSTRATPVARWSTRTARSSASTPRSRPTGSGSDGNIGVGFAIPSNRAKQVADDIIGGTSVSHPQLGVGVTTADDNAGALVRTVSSGSAADKAGLQGRRRHHRLQRQRGAHVRGSAQRRAGRRRRTRR